jgi:phosphoglycolate phosphatase-like HAD superfamily hydrolase
MHDQEPTDSAPPRRRVHALALDFDGVLCDSAAEMAVSAWRAGAELWPDWRGSAQPPAPLAEAFRRVRPLVDTGWQSLVLLRLLADGAPPAALLAAGPERLPAEAQARGLDPATGIRLFAAARDRWIAEDAAGWLGAHRFYPGVAEQLAVWQAAGLPLFILTTKQERFTLRLLAAAGVPLAATAVFGLERGRRKEEILAELLARPAAAGWPWHFVEDRLAALEAAAAVPALASVRLHFATWGYGTAADAARARALRRIASLTLDAFTAPDFPQD